MTLKLKFEFIFILFVQNKSCIKFSDRHSAILQTVLRKPDMHLLTFSENRQNRSLPWRNESTQKPPQAVLPVTECGADAVLKNARARTATLWRGDFHNAKQVLSAVKKRLRKPAAKPDAARSAAETFHLHRMQQAQQAQLVNMLAVEIGTGFMLDLPRAPDVAAALGDVYGEPNSKPFLLPLNQLLGFIGAHEWHKKGMETAGLDRRIHVPFGVFSPLRGEYLDLINQAPLPAGCRTAFDIGTGSGVIAALLAKRGIPHITATDNNPRATACAEQNIRRLGFERQVTVLQTDLFPEGRADLIVCNPPWLPAKPTSAIETALYDPESIMLKSFLRDATAHLNPDGQIWLAMSNLAEHLGLRPPGGLEVMIQSYGWQIKNVLHTRPKHAKAADSADPLAFARMRETTFLYCLQAF